MLTLNGAFCLFVVAATAFGCRATATPSTSVPAATSASEHAALSDIEEFIAEVVELEATPGLAVAIVRGEDTIFKRGFGFRDFGKKLPLTEDTPFYIASHTKAFVGTLAAVLATQGRLDLDAPVSRYLPAVFGDREPWKTVRVRDLLRHTHGIENRGVEVRTAFSGDFSKQTLVEFLSTRSKGTDRSFAYSNLGYVIASLIIEEVDGQPWQNSLSVHVLKSLGLSKTTARISETAGWSLAQPHVRVQDGFKVIPYAKSDKTMHAAGGMISNVGDLATWVAVHLNRGKLQGRVVLPKMAVTEAQRQQAKVDQTFWQFERIAYGFGWYHSKYDGDDLMHHFGAFPGFRAHVSFMPERGIGIVVLTNEAKAGFHVSDVVAAYAYDRLIGKQTTPPRRASYLNFIREEVAAWLAKREKIRTWTSKAVPPTVDAKYLGRFENPDFGVVELTVVDGKLQVTWGELRTVAYDVGGGRLLVPFFQEAGFGFTFAGEKELSADELRVNFHGIPMTFARTQ